MDGELKIVDKSAKDQTVSNEASELKSLRTQVKVLDCPDIQLMSTLLDPRD